MTKTPTALPIAIALVALGSSLQAAEDVATGCLNPAGKITKLAIGEAPLRPCRARETEIRLSLGAEKSEEFEQIPFLVLLNGDDSEQTIVTHGPLQLTVRCDLNAQDPNNPDRMLDVVSLVLTSSEDDWISTASQGLIPSENEVILLSSGDNLQSDFPNYVASSPANNGGSGLASGGFYLGVVADTVGFGTSILDHDCVAVGIAMLLEIPLP